MVRIWLKPNWKEILDEKIAIVEISGGTVSDYEISEGVRFTVIDHDNLEEELPFILESLGYEDYDELAEEIYDDVVDIMKDTGEENLLSIVKMIMIHN